MGDRTWRWPVASVLALAACGDDGLVAGDGEGEGGLPAVHLARIVATLDGPTPRDDQGPSGLAVSGRFARALGFDEDQVRTHVDLPPLPDVVLRPGSCAPLSQLSGFGRPAAPSEATPRHLVLVDVGRLVVRVDDSSLDVPVALVPDLLPYMSGVEYELGAVLPGLLADNPRQLTLEFEGAVDERLPPFSATLDIPVPLRIRAFELEASELRDHIVRLDWEPIGRTGDRVVLQFSSRLGDDALGDDVVCVVADSGRANVDLVGLFELGLPHGDRLEVIASRSARTTRAAGSFDDLELVVQVRDRTAIGLE